MKDLLDLLFAGGFNYQRINSSGWRYYNSGKRWAVFYRYGVLLYDSETGREICTEDESVAIRYVLDSWDTVEG